MVNQSGFEVSTYNFAEAWENTGVQVTLGLSFASHRLEKKWLKRFNHSLSLVVAIA